MTDSTASTDVQEAYRQVAKGFDAVVRQVAPDQWSARSPCELWSARDVVGHVVAGHRGVEAAVRGETPEPLEDGTDMRAAWDLARAVGGDERLDEGSVRQAYETLKPMDAMIQRLGVFGPGKAGERLTAPRGGSGPP